MTEDVSKPVTILLSWFILAETSMSNMKSLHYWNLRQWESLSLKKKVSTLQLWSDGAPNDYVCQSVLCNFSHTNSII